MKKENFSKFFEKHVQETKYLQKLSELIKQKFHSDEPFEHFW